MTGKYPGNGLAGFLLFEVLISLVILSTGLLVITRVYSSSKDAIVRSTDLIKTSLLLESKMFEFENGEIEVLTKSGDFSEENSYSWELNVNEEKDAEYVRVILDVFKKRKPETTKYSLVTYLPVKKESSEENE